MRSHGLVSLLGMVCVWRAQLTTTHPTVRSLNPRRCRGPVRREGGKTCAPTGLVSPLGVVCAEGPTHHNSPNCAQPESPSTLWAREERGGKHALPRA